MASQIRTVIVEMPSPERDRLVASLSEEPEIEVLASCASVGDAMGVIRALTPDLVWVDLQTPGLDEFNGFAELRPAVPLVIVATTREDAALKAFELPAVDCLLKPFGRERLRQALAQVEARLAERRQAQLARRFASLVDESAEAAPGVSNKLAVKSGGRVVLLHLVELDAVESEGNYVRLHTRGVAHLVRETMANIEGRLGGQRFCRIHRGWIVNLDRVKEVIPRPNADPELLMRDGRRLRIGRAYREAVQQRLIEVRSGKC